MPSAVQNPFLIPIHLIVLITLFHRDSYPHFTDVETDTEKLENLPQTRQEVAEPRTQLPDLKVSNRNRYNFLLLRQRVDEKTEYQRGKVTCQGCTANE